VSNIGRIGDLLRPIVAEQEKKRKVEPEPEAPPATEGEEQPKGGQEQ